ncbi:hypothetical protein NQK81_02170 [Amycolatopsis roodepoortensis]|uniref:hypothetical protein n=1 Tax=Amycolatopsis roodepoortensis TaxID=700274 RepID=UPI00214BB3E6|nr:hypothetical protein [Amycolatopsis roodepoortensis]UUV32280.1 hypothetical protein NQK81_02170 [Amycolatopsis roodepoortensis]
MTESEVRHDQQRVVGWLALTLQHKTGLLDGPRVAYTITDHGTIELTWRGGPTAAAVADRLLATADPDVPVVRRREPGSDTERVRRDFVEAAGVPVMLTATDPRPHRDPSDWISKLPAVRAPQPMVEDGHAADVVTWELPPDPGGSGIAVVTRVPTPYLDNHTWTAPAETVVNVDHEFPPGAHDDRRSSWKHAVNTAAVHLRFVPDDLVTADADTWLTQVHTSTWLRPECAAVVWHDRCLLQLSSGLRVDAVFDRFPHLTGTSSRVPAVVLSALSRWSTRPGPVDAAAQARLLPAELHLSRFGHGQDYDRYRVDVQATVASATRT